MNITAFSHIKFNNSELMAFDFGRLNKETPTQLSTEVWHLFTLLAVVSNCQQGNQICSTVQFSPDTVNHFIAYIMS